ncbi:hypothetical protein CERZMDRAFT_114533 [Cercospora zeae-maydis SCOH1-5]|uniref:Chromatin assembly factor 1 subunit A n=1 Tax=Cercospora zeae-maydis SCOH1-5 TaxID=717836 RepID=A0A6A6F452_9PEZI|nr:hypothetical protein CERZMDRAFT_114533 [Cercospora zeae-maydis SCOH1-5]
MPTPPDTENERSSNASPGGSIGQERHERAASPALSTSTTLSSVVDITSGHDVHPSTGVATQSTAPASTSASASGPPPAKRRKLTPAEKLEQAQAKEAKARERAEKKALAEEKKAQVEAEKVRKEAEREEKKAQVDEEKARKAEEKRAKAEEKEAKKREKELEDAKKQEEKLAKERKQMRLGAFFGGKPSTPAKANADGEENMPRSRRKSLSLEPFDAVADQIRSTASPAKRSPALSKKPVYSDYQKTFLPFEAPKHTVLARAPSRDKQGDQARFDHELNDPLIREKYDLGLIWAYTNIDSYFGELRKSPRGRRGHPNVRKIFEKAQGTLKEPIDLTEEASNESPDALLRKVDIKYVHFSEDVRPAYCGTYTKITSPRTTRRTMRNPFARTRPDTDYDYDSEAEWEEPEEGEDLGSDDDEEADSNADADEMDDFLDDEDDKVKAKRKVVTTELIPECSGLCFANERGRVSTVNGAPVTTQPLAMDGMHMGFLLPNFTGMTIDPFSTSYWEKPVSAPAAASKQPAAGTAMAPPRKPLEPRLNFNHSAESAVFALIGAAEGDKGPITSATALAPAVKRGRKPQPRTLSKEDLEELKEAVVGSPLGKLELHKGLKARFPKLTNDAIKENLSSLFAQKGSGKDKTWVYIGDL